MFLVYIIMLFLFTFFVFFFYQMFKFFSHCWNSYILITSCFFTFYYTESFSVLVQTCKRFPRLTHLLCPPSGREHLQEVSSGVTNVQPPLTLSLRRPAVHHLPVSNVLELEKMVHGLPSIGNLWPDPLRNIAPLPDYDCADKNIDRFYFGASFGLSGLCPVPCVMEAGMFYSIHFLSSDLQA